MNVQETLCESGIRRNGESAHEKLDVKRNLSAADNAFMFELRYGGKRHERRSKDRL